MPEAPKADLQFWAPASFSLLLAGLSAAAREAEAHTFEAAYDEVASHTLERLQRHLGRSRHVNERLDLTKTIHASSEDDPWGWHHHVVVSGANASLDSVGLFEAVERSIWGAYLRKLRELTTSLGLVWARPAPGASYEITSPPLHEGTPVNPPRSCTLVQAGERLVLPTAEQHHRDRQQQSAIRASGLAYDRPRGSL